MLFRHYPGESLQSVQMYKQESKRGMAWDLGEAFSFQHCESKGKVTKPGKLSLCLMGCMKLIRECARVENE